MIRSTLLLVSILFFIVSSCSSTEQSETDSDDRGGKSDMITGSCAPEDCGTQSANGAGWCDDQCASFGDCASGAADVCGFDECEDDDGCVDAICILGNFNRCAPEEEEEVPTVGGEVVWTAAFGIANRLSKLSVNATSDGGAIAFGQPFEVNGGPAVGLDNAELLGPAGASDEFLIKTNGDGEPTWFRRIQSGGAEVLDAVSDRAGNTYLTASFQAANFGGGIEMAPNDGCTGIFVVKYGPAGEFLWNKKIGGAPNGCVKQAASSIALDRDDNVFLVGRASGNLEFSGDGGSISVPLPRFLSTVLVKIDSEGLPIWAAESPVTRQVLDTGFDDDGNVYLLSEGFDSQTFKITKVDDAGTEVWVRTIDFPARKVARRIAVDNDGTVLVTGQFMSGIDFGDGLLESVGDWDAFLAKFSSEGDIVFSMVLGSTGFDAGHGVAFGPAGEVVVSGQHNRDLEIGAIELDAPANQTNGFVAVFDADGEALWARSLGGIDHQSAYDVATDDDGNVIVGGGFSTSIDVGTGPLPTSGPLAGFHRDTGVYLAKFSIR